MWTELGFESISDFGMVLGGEVGQLGGSGGIVFFLLFFGYEGERFFCAILFFV